MNKKHHLYSALDKGAVKNDGHSPFFFFFLTINVF